MKYLLLYIYIYTYIYIALYIHCLSCFFNDSCNLACLLHAFVSCVTVLISVVSLFCKLCSCFNCWIHIFYCFRIIISTYKLTSFIFSVQIFCNIISVLYVASFPFPFTYSLSTSACGCCILYIVNISLVCLSVFFISFNLRFITKH